MLPHSIRTAAAERHDYQVQMIGKVMEVLISLEAARASVLREVEARFEAFPEEKATAKASHTASVERVVAASDFRMEKEAARKEAERCRDRHGRGSGGERGRGRGFRQVALAERALIGAREKVKSLDGEHASAEAEKIELEDLIRKHFEPLKAGAFTGMQWRQRDRCIIEVSEALEKLGAEESLRTAMANAFRRKTRDNTKFSHVSVKYGEEIITKRLATLEEEVDGYEDEKHRRDQALRHAAASLEAARRAQDKGATAARGEAEVAVAVLEPKGASSAALLKRARAELNEVQQCLARFRVLSAGPRRKELTEYAA
uniref:Uncharacterized protein n=1 Tax=Alexandrium catenella TaxID=2925 RepID=A0A7S1MT22_ALECA